MRAIHAFGGRTAELQLLAAALHRAAEGEPGFIFLSGTAGIGKSALLQQFCRRAASRERPGWVIDVRPSSGEEYRPVEDAARAASLRHRISGSGGKLGFARAVLPDWIAAIPGIGNVAAALIATGTALRQRRVRGAASRAGLTLDGASESLLREARRHPIIVVADDLQRMSEEGTVQIEHLVRCAAGGTHLLFVGTFTSSAPGRQKLAVERLLALAHQSCVRQHVLLELDVSDISAWLARRFPGLDRSSELATQLAQNTGGHPASVDRALEQLLASRVIRFEGGHWKHCPEDGTVPAVVSAAELPVELQEIDPRVLDLLLIASGTGDTFDGTQLALRMGLDELKVEDRLALAVHRGFLRVTGEEADGNGEISTIYTFTSSNLRATLAKGGAGWRTTEAPMPPTPRSADLPADTPARQVQ